MQLRLAIAALVFAAPGAAVAADLGATGTLSGTATALGWRVQDTAGDTTNTGLTRLRLQLDGARQTNAGDLSWLAVYDNEVLGLAAVPGPEPTYLDLHRQVTSVGNYRWTHRISRASLAWETDGGRFILGRQRVAWGSGRLWNPTDRFNPSSPTAFESGEKTGSDALMAERYIGTFGALQFVAAPGKHDRGVSRKIAARWRDTVGETDYALLGGRIGGEPIVGLDLATNFLGGGLYFEATAGWPKDEARYVQSSTGYDTVWQLPFLVDTVTIGIEYFRNTAANGQKSAALATDRLQTRRQHLFALSGGYDISFLWRASGTLLLDTETASWALVPSLLWSAAQNVDVQFLAQFYRGEIGSEYGTGQNALVVRISAYF